MAAYVGIDLGGTNLRGAVVDERGEVLVEDAAPLGPRRDPEEVADRIAALVTLLREEVGRKGATVDRVGVGVAAWLDVRNGIVANAPNIGWRDVPLRGMLRRRLDVPVTLYNDLNAATYGEWVHGAGRGATRLLCVFVGSGVGSGMVIDGRMYEGATGYAGEIGHMVVKAGGELCGCGGLGHLEAYAGGRPIEQRVRRLAREGAYAGVLARAKGRPEAITMGTLDEAAAAGDPDALELWEEAAGYLAIGLASALNLLNPEMLILGGGVLEGATTYRNLTLEKLRETALPMVFQDLTITLPQLGGRAGVLGAALLARDLWH